VTFTLESSASQDICRPTRTCNNFDVEISNFVVEQIKMSYERRKSLKYFRWHTAHLTQSDCSPVRQSKNDSMFNSRMKHSRGVGSIGRLTIERSRGK
jgi:hypothetical protein